MTWREGERDKQLNINMKHNARPIKNVILRTLAICVLALSNPYLALIVKTLALGDIFIYIYHDWIVRGGC